jgi:hypothetical protein
VQFIDTTKRKWCYKGFLRSFIYFTLLNLSPRNVVLSRGTGIVFSKSWTCALVAKTKLMRDTFRVYPGISVLPGVSGFAPDTPCLKASTAIFWVRGYKSPLHPFLYSPSYHFDLNSFTPLLAPLLPLAPLLAPLLPLAQVWWNLSWGFKRVWEQDFGEC